MINQVKENVLTVSKKLWKAMQDRDIDTFEAYTHQDAIFVHMGVTLSRDEEAMVIKNGGIVYKTIVFEEETVKAMEATIIVLTKLKLTAIVGGHEVVNPFVVTEVYTNHADMYMLASLSYTRINY